MSKHDKRKEKTNGCIHMDDLKGSMSSKFIDVQEDVEREVNGALEDFGKQLKKAIDKKLTQLKQYV